VIDGAIGMFGNITYSTRDEIEKKLKLIDAADKKYKPLIDTEINGEALGLIAILRPLLSNMLKDLGDNLHFFLFPAEEKKGKLIIDTEKEGKFTIQLDKTDYLWKLPINCLLPPKYDPDTGEELNGAWKFSPFTGKKLLDKPPIKPEEKK